MHEKHRDKVAFAWYNKNELQKATYGDFANDICILASKIELKTGQGKHIGVIGENSYDWLVVYLAIIFSGNVAVLLDKDMSEDELSDCVERMDISILLSDAALPCPD